MTTRSEAEAALLGFVLEAVSAEPRTYEEIAEAAQVEPQLTFAVLGLLEARGQIVRGLQRKARRSDPTKPVQRRVYMRPVSRVE